MCLDTKTFWTRLWPHLFSKWIHCFFPRQNAERENHTTLQGIHSVRILIWHETVFTHIGRLWHNGHLGTKYLLKVLGIKLRTSYMQNMHSTTELHPKHQRDDSHWQQHGVSSKSRFTLLERNFWGLMIWMTKLFNSWAINVKLVTVSSRIGSVIHLCSHNPFPPQTKSCSLLQYRNYNNPY